MTTNFYMTTTDGHLACRGHRDVVCNVADHIFDRDAYGICDCVDDAAAACPVCSLTVNVSNRNAFLILDRLGLEADYCGACAPADILGRAMLGNIGRDDSGMPDVIGEGVGPFANANFVDCGVDAGYFEARLEQIANLATYAAQHGFVVSWG